MPTFTQSLPTEDISGVQTFIQSQFPPGTPLAMTTSNNKVLVIDMPTVDQTSFDTVISQLRNNFPSAMNVGGSMFVPFTISPGAAPITWLNLPAAVTEFLGLTIHRTVAYFANFKEAQFIVNVQVAGSTGTRLAIQGSVDGGVTWLFLDGSATANATNSLLIDSSGVKTSSVIALPLGARGNNVLLRLVGGAGNGIVSPQFGAIQLQIR